MLKLLLALRNRKASRGFTLIELLVVVAIIGLLAAFAVPKLFEAINTSKEAQGQADLDTISAALERYYFENGFYPAPDGDAVDKTATPPDLQATDLKEALAPYLKKNTTFLNGFKKGLFYGTNADGTAGYVLIDPKNTTAAIAAVCGTGGPAWTPGTALTVNKTLTKALIDACAAPTGMDIETN